MSKGAIGAIVAVIVVIVLILGLGFSGVIPGFKLGGSTSSSSGPKYNVTFTESGLPSSSVGTVAGVSWSVTLGGSSQSSSTNTIVFSEPNGTYSYSASAVGYTPLPASGSITVHGSPQAQSIAFTALQAGVYLVTFSESGLTAGTSWSVTLNGSQNISSGTSILFTEQNGSYSFTVGTVTGYTAAPASGEITVTGAAVLQGITFTSSGGGGGSGQVAESQALPVAQSQANMESGSWLPIFGAGVSLTSQWSNSSMPQFNSSCNFVGGSGAWPTIPAWTGTYANGKLTLWLFFFYNSTPTATVQAIYVLGGSATLLGTLTGSDCVGEFSHETGLAGIIDSTTAASDVAANDSAYLAANPSANSEFVGFGGESFMQGSISFTVSPSWYVYFSTCSASGGGTGNNFTAIVNGTSGVVEYSNITTGASCGASGFASVQPGSTDSSPSGDTAASVLLRGD
jgi:hypothetical protein